MSRTKYIVSGVSWTVIQNVVNILYGIVCVPFLINYFGKDEYGLIGLALSVNVYIHLFDMGMTNSNVRFFSEYIAIGNQEKLQKLFSLTHLFYTIIGIFNTVILFGLSFCVDVLFKVTPEQAITLRNLLWILALNATFSWISICFDQLLRANELIDWIKKRLIILKVLQFVVLLSTILFHFSIEVYFFGYIFMATVILPLTVIKAKKIMPSLILNWRFDKEVFQTVFPYAFGIFSFSIFHFMAFNFRPLFLGGMAGPGAVAEFNIMYTITQVVTILSGSFMQVLLPVVTKMKVKSEGQAINRIIFTGTKYANILLSVLIVLLIINSQDLLNLYVGSEYIMLSPWLVLWLLTLLLSHRNVMTALVFTEKKIKSVAVMGAVAMCLALICYVTLIPRYGVGGVVIGFTVHELTHALFYYFYFLPRKFRIDTKTVFLRAVLPVWLGLGIAGIIVYYGFHFFSLDTLTNVILKTLVCLALIIPVIWKMLFDDNDRAFVLSFIQRRH